MPTKVSAIGPRARASAAGNMPVICPVSPMQITETTAPLLEPPLLERAQALLRAEGNISSTAKLLGISRPTLYDLMRQYALNS